jgi:hypothetical protein
MLVYSESIPQYNISHLLDLVRLGHGPFGLEVQDFLNICTRKNVMIASYSLREIKMQQKLNQIGEADIGVRPSAEDTFQNLRMSSHGTGSPLCGYCLRLTKPRLAVLFTRIGFCIRCSAMPRIIARPDEQDKQVPEESATYRSYAMNARPHCQSVPTLYAAVGKQP